MRPEGPKHGARRAEAGVGFLERGQLAHAPPHQLGGLGERCKLPHWGPGRSPAAVDFLVLFESRRTLVETTIV